MAKIKNDPALLERALLGFNGDLEGDAPGYFSSAVWLAFVAGRQVAKFYERKPIRCAMSRGYSVKIEIEDGTRLLIEFRGDYLAPQIPLRIA